MNFEKILEYQRLDAELLAIENEVAKSNERALVFAVKAKIDSATELIGKLSQESADLLSAYVKMKSKIDSLKARLDEFDGVTEGIADTAEADYYIRQITAISDEIAALEKEAGRDSARIDGINAEYKRTWETGIKETAHYKQAKAALDKLVAERQPRVDELRAQLAELKKSIPAEFMEMYSSLRADRKMPAFVEYNPAVNSCGRCFMDVPNDTRGNLKNPGDWAECPNCRRILFIPRG